MRLSTVLSASFTALVSAQTPPNLTALLSSQPQLSGLVQLLGLVPNVTSALVSARNVTIFAPSNQALAAIASAGVPDSRVVEALLRYHVVKGVVRSSAITQTAAFAPTLLDYSTPLQGGGVVGSNVTGGQVISAQVQNGSVILTTGLKATSKVVQADLAFTNGVVHVIDALLTIPRPISETVVAGNFSSLATAATRANLIPTLDNTRDLTVFVPNNAAFQAIASVAANLTVAELTAVLGYHVIAGTVAYSTTLKSGAVRTLNGQNVNIRVETNGTVFVNQARVITADILVANGVAHVIDSVLIPSASTPTTTRPTSGATSTTRGPAQVTTNAAVGGLKVGVMEMAVLVGGVVGLGL